MAFEPPTDVTGGAGAAEHRRQLGIDRFTAMVEAQAHVDAMQAFLTLALGAVPMQGYSDEAIAAAIEDVKDFERAARNLSTVSRQLLDEWKQQRRRAEREAKRGQS